jgi:plastocyanin
MVPARPLVLAGALALVLAGCGGGSKVGEGIEEKAGGGTADTTCRLGECTTTTTPPPTTTTTATGATARTATTTTTRLPTTTTTIRPTTTTQPRPTLVVRIQSDNAAGGQFDPRNAEVSRGALVRWTNGDAVARSVVADGGTFTSPSIPPGGSWDYTASTSGTFNYHDGTRPYAVGTLTVSS